VPGTLLDIDPKELAAYRPSYRYLAWYQNRLGFQLRSDLLGDDQPEPVARQYLAEAAWLAASLHPNNAGCRPGGAPRRRVPPCRALLAGSARLSLCISLTADPARVAGESGRRPADRSGEGRAERAGRDILAAADKDATDQFLRISA
jgi:hypothetical protein